MKINLLNYRNSPQLRIPHLDEQSVLLLGIDERVASTACGEVYDKGECGADGESRIEEEDDVSCGVSPLRVSDVLGGAYEDRRRDPSVGDREGEHEEERDGIGCGGRGALCAHIAEDEERREEDTERDDQEDRTRRMELEGEIPSDRISRVEDDKHQGSEEVPPLASPVWARTDD